MWFVYILQTFSTQFSSKKFYTYCIIRDHVVKHKMNSLLADSLNVWLTQDGDLFFIPQWCCLSVITVRRTRWFYVFPVSNYCWQVLVDWSNWGVFVERKIRQRSTSWAIKRTLVEATLLENLEKENAGRILFVSHWNGWMRKETQFWMQPDLMKVIVQTHYCLIRLSAVELSQ